MAPGITPLISNLGSPDFNAVSKNDVDNTYGGYSGEKAPDWRERHYMMKSSGNPIGIFKGPVDENFTAHFTLYQPDQGECPMLPLESTLMDPMDWDTQIAFETLPILEVWHYANNGILLKFPD
jgi:hypothetical protein